VCDWVLVSGDLGKGLESFQGQLYESYLEHHEAVQSGRKRSGKSRGNTEDASSLQKVLNRSCHIRSLNRSGY